MLQSVTNGNEGVTNYEITVNRGDTVRLFETKTVTKDKIPVIAPVPSLTIRSHGS
jgi:ribosomal protein S17